jgi:hypothetical protein
LCSPNCRRRLANLRNAVKLTSAKVIDVVDHVIGAQFVQPIEVTIVEEMTMESDQLLDRDAVLGAARHGPTLLIRFRKLWTRPPCNARG